MVKLVHNFTTMLLWEEITGKPFELNGVGDVMKYMYLCFRHSGGDENTTLEEFCDAMRPEDVEDFRAQMEWKGDGTTQEDGKKKALAIFSLIASFILACILIMYLTR